MWPTAELNDAETIQAFAKQLNDEIRNLKLQIEKQKLLVENCTEKLNFKQDQSNLISRQRAQFERILATYTEDIVSSFDCLPC
jgi:hypothetical protein